jgi:hypothetical protein
MAQEIEDRVTRLDLTIEKLGASALEVAAVAAAKPGCSSNCSNKAAFATEEEVATLKQQK